MTRKPEAMLVAGVMSGTSADGVDVAVVRVSPGGSVPEIELLGHSEFPYPAAVREAVLQAASGETKTADLSRLNWQLGELYAECVERACVGQPPLELVGMHGQTVYHEAGVATWQIGEAAVVAERLRVPVVSDFRPADLAAGGQAAPLVPMLDYTLFRDEAINRVLLNLGGIANMTAIPAGAGLGEVIAFDSGPANMIVDALMLKLYGRGFDCGGTAAERGTVIEGVVEALMEDDYFALAPPKSCGREQYGAAYASRVHALCAAAGAKKVDVIAIASELTVQTVFAAFERFCRPVLKAGATEFIVAGGGTRNEHLMRRLRNVFADAGVTVQPIDELGMPSQAKEATAFALLGWLSWHGLPGNVPSATGANRAVVLGKVSLG